MGTVAEGLFVAETALAPEVAFTGYNFDAVRLFLGNRRCITHLVFSMFWSHKFAGLKECDQEEAYRLGSS